MIQKRLEHDSDKLQLVARILQEVGQKDKTYRDLMNTVANTLTDVATKGKAAIVKEHKELHTAMGNQAQEFFRRYNNVKQRNATSDKVLQEMKKQMGCYKEEIDNMQKMESHMTAENYQKLVNDFNQLYDHYKLHKVTAKKLKAELFQSNHRERTFLNLLKNTQEYGEQAKLLEQEYDKLYEQGEEQYNLSNTQKFIEVANNIQIPKLDLSIIHIQQREGLDSSASTNQQEQNDEEDESSSAPVTGQARDPNDISQTDIQLRTDVQAQMLQAQKKKQPKQQEILLKDEDGFGAGGPNQVLKQQPPSEGELTASLESSTVKHKTQKK